VVSDKFLVARPINKDDNLALQGAKRNAGMGPKAALADQSDLKIGHPPERRLNRRACCIKLRSGPRDFLAHSKLH
jgi:hypothetical protein